MTNHPFARMINTAIVITLLVAALGIAFARPQNDPRAAAPASFVYACGIHFCQDGKPYYFASPNTYDVFTYGDGSSNTTTSVTPATSPGAISKPSDRTVTR